MTIFNDIAKHNSNALAIVHSSAWNVHKCKFSDQSKAYKDADKLAKKLASEYSKTNFNIYAVFGAIGQFAHTRSEIILVALADNEELNRCGRVHRQLITVR